MRRMATGVLAVLVALLIAGCGGKNSDKVIGVWKSVDKRGGRHQFVEIAKEKMDIDGKAADVVLEDRDGKVSIRLAGRDEIVAVITIVDDKNIEIDFSGMLGGKLTLIKSSAEERTAADHPPVDKIVGFWKSGGGGEDTPAVLEIGKSHIAHGAEKADVAFETQKGQYIVSGADAFTGTISQADDNTLQVSLMRVQNTFSRTTKEEADAIAAKARAALQPYLGMWRSENTFGLQRDFHILEIGEDHIVQNGEKKPAALSASKTGLRASFGRFDQLNLSLVDDDTITTGAGWSKTTYYRTTPEDLKKLQNPDIADFTGMWILDSDDSTYKALALDGKMIYRDGLKQAFEVVSPGPNQLNLRQPGNEKFSLARLSHIGPNRIAVRNTGGVLGKDDTPYRRATQEEFAKALAGMVDLFGAIPGYWRSAEPVTDKGAYATMHIQFNVQGQKAKGQCDRVEHHFLESSYRNPRTDHAPRVVEGVIGHPGGNTSKPISLLTPDDESRWYLTFTVQSVNAMEATYAHGKPIKMVRSTKEDNDKLRAATKQK